MGYSMVMLHQLEKNGLTSDVSTRYTVLQKSILAATVLEKKVKLPAGVVVLQDLR